jgi:hypothetical protein
MWIDDRTADIKVYETNPGDPFIKKMTWIPENHAWVLFAKKSDLMVVAEELGDPAQIQVCKDWEAGKMSYAEMRGLIG